MSTISAIMFGQRKNKSNNYLEVIEKLKKKASTRPIIVNGIFNKDNANYNTGINEAIDLLYELIEKE